MSRNASEEIVPGRENDAWSRPSTPVAGMHKLPGPVLPRQIDFRHCCGPANSLIFFRQTSRFTFNDRPNQDDTEYTGTRSFAPYFNLFLLYKARPEPRIQSQLARHNRNPNISTKQFILKNIFTKLWRTHSAPRASSSSWQRLSQHMPRRTQIPTSAAPMKLLPSSHMRVWSQLGFGSWALERTTRLVRPTFL